MSVNDTKRNAFYQLNYFRSGSALHPPPETHDHFSQLGNFVVEYQLYDKRCLEIGCSTGVFQDLVSDYTGIDISRTVREHLHKAFCVSSATELPFPDDTFDAIWTLYVVEHVPDPEKALAEMRRVIKPGGVLLLAPAWRCSPWNAQGYPVRPYRDLNWKGKLIKASLPIQESFPYRTTSIILGRAIRSLVFLTRRGPMPFSFRQLTPNYDKFWMYDADAVGSLDPYEAILWFTSRGDKCLSSPTLHSQFLVKNKLGIVSTSEF